MRISSVLQIFIFSFFFNDTATTEIYTLSLHDALPISCRRRPADSRGAAAEIIVQCRAPDRKSTRLNSQSQSNLVCRLLLEKKKKKKISDWFKKRKKKTNKINI